MKPLYKLSTALLTLTAYIGVTACQAKPPSQSLEQMITNAAIGNTVKDKATAIAPWSNPTIDNLQTDAVYRQEWMKAKTKSLCPIIALPNQAASHLMKHSVRRASFSGGWGVAYDLPDIRSAYGVANSGTTRPEELTFSWPYNIRYQDGSTVGYGHEGGDPSAKWLAYIVIPQNNCFYNVWSAQGKMHLEQMIVDLRIVNP